MRIRVVFISVERVICVKFAMRQKIVTRQEHQSTHHQQNARATHIPDWQSGEKVKKSSHVQQHQT